tara:strand:+ start:5591 stop:6034 length:444 start_codon:yes stop_codon:yes gene_type:complete
MKKDKRIKFEFTISGFIIGLILVAMFSSTFFTFATQMEDSYNVTTPGGLTLKKYNATAKIIDEAEKIRQDVEIKEDVSAIDIIGGFFKSGFAALNTAANSFSLFNQLTNDAAQDVEALDLLKTYLQAIILIALFVGVLLSVLTKMRI